MNCIKRRRRAFVEGLAIHLNICFFCWKPKIWIYKESLAVKSVFKLLRMVIQPYWVNACQAWVQKPYRVNACQAWVKTQYRVNACQAWVQKPYRVNACQAWVQTPSIVPRVFSSKKRYYRDAVIIGSRKWFEHDFIIELN